MVEKTRLGIRQVFKEWIFSAFDSQNNLLVYEAETVDFF